MFVCEMIDYSEMRDVTPHLGRISMLEDKDGDGYFETSTVFADDLAVAHRRHLRERRHLRHRHAGRLVFQGHRRRRARPTCARRSSPASAPA